MLHGLGYPLARTGPIGDLDHRLGIKAEELQAVSRQQLSDFWAARVGPFARDSERFDIRLLIGGIKKPR